MTDQAKEIKEKFDEMKAQRSNWDQQYQVLGEYISLVKQNFEGQPANGEFLTEDIFDSMGSFAAMNSASALLGMLWGGSAKQTLELIQPEGLEETEEVEDFYKKVSAKLSQAMDDPKANLSLALDEYMLDQMIFGTGGVGVEEGEESDLLYKAYSVTNCYIDEGKAGRVDTVALFYEWTAKRVIAEYGEENVSSKVRELANKSNTSEKVKILIMIRPRAMAKAKKGKLAMPYESVHMEYADCHVLREDGFEELPIPVVRFRKLAYEKYGRSPGMNALADIKEMNILREAMITATEKTIYPPLGVFNDGVVGGGYVDTSPNAVSVFNPVGTSGNASPVFQIGDTPRLQDAENRMTALIESISQHFHIDRLIDFNNDTQMTFGEAQIRNNVRLSSLQGLFARQITELFTPLIERSFNILWRRGEFGVVAGTEVEAQRLEDGLDVEYLPEAITKLMDEGKPVYEIGYKTAAKTAARAEEYIAILDVLQLVGQAAQFEPSVLNRIDMHEAIKVVGDIRSLPPGIIRQDDEVEEIQQAQQQQAERQQLLDNLQQGSEIAQNVAGAEATLQ